jgi:hypothetical protein
MKISEPNRKLWLWLCDQGGTWTVQEILQRYGGDSGKVFRALHGMHRRELVAQFPPLPGQFRKRYGVTGTCLVPYGVSVAEAQA